MTKPIPQITESPTGSDQHPRLLSFPEPRSLSKSVRASALVFEDPVSRQLLSDMERIAPSDATVLIVGETGTGKELVARHVHALSRRRNNPFGALNCAALTETLIESELFGHEKGAFTGALTAKAGWFETAHQGTLFLDEVGDLPAASQVKLLRVLQEREVVRVGARQPTPIDVRVIAATNVDLERAVQVGHFRTDLYYRFNVATLHLRPLRERRGDILPLARHFITIYGERLSCHDTALSPGAESLLLEYHWPGNIRELENAIHRALLVCRNNELNPEDFKLTPLRHAGLQTAAAAVSTGSLEQALHSLYAHAPVNLFGTIEETVIRTAYDFCERNQVQTAQLLGITRNVLRHRLSAYQLLPNRGTSAAKGLPPTTAPRGNGTACLHPASVDGG